LAALDLNTDVEQLVDCLIVKNGQAMQSIEKSMDWLLEDYVVNVSFVCATLTGPRGEHTPFVQAGAETPDIHGEAVKPDPGSSWEAHSRGMSAGVLN